MLGRPGPEGEGLLPGRLQEGVPVRLGACLSSPFPWPPPGTCLPSSRPRSWKAGGTICLDLRAPEKTPPPLSPPAPRRGWALPLSLRSFPEGPRWEQCSLSLRVGASASPWPVGRLAEVRGEGDSAQRKLDAQAVGSQSRAAPTFEFGVWGSLDGWPLAPPPRPLPSSRNFLPALPGAPQTPCLTDLLPPERPPLVVATPRSWNVPRRLLLRLASWKGRDPAGLSFHL